MDARATELAPAAIRRLLRTITGIITTIVVTGIIAIARGLWELVTHRSVVDIKKTLSASGRSAFATMTIGRTFQPNRNEMTMAVDSHATGHFLDDELAILVDSGAAEYFLDGELISGLKDRVINPTLRRVPQNRNNTSEEATFAETEGQCAQIQDSQLQRPSNPSERDK